jgi:hypothetical protein
MKTLIVAVGMALAANMGFVNADANINADVDMKSVQAVELYTVDALVQDYRPADPDEPLPPPKLSDYTLDELYRALEKPCYNDPSCLQILVEGQMMQPSLQMKMR